MPITFRLMTGLFFFYFYPARKLSVGHISMSSEHHTVRTKDSFNRGPTWNPASLYYSKGAAENLPGQTVLHQATLPPSENPHL